MAPGRGSNFDFYLKTLGGIVVVLSFIVFVLPNILDLSTYLSQGTDAGTQEGVELVEDLVVNWWVPLALSAPFVFVAVAVFLQLIGAGEVLEM